MQLADKLYTSTEVAQILGVSLRSVYRYLEDGKLDAEIKTATGRLRFTKQNIMDFLQPGDRGGVSKPVGEKIEVEEAIVVASVQAEVVPEPVVEPTPEVEPAEDESIDWLERFRASAEKFRKEQEATTADEPVVIEEPEVPEQPKVEEEVTEDFDIAVEDEISAENVSGLVDVEPEEVEAQPQYSQTVYFYRSLVGGLKDIAQNIDKVSRRSNVDYTFTLNAGLSLYKPLRDPFSVLHAYVRPDDRDLFEKLLRLVPSDESNAQLCLITSDDSLVFDTKSELHGLFVVSKAQIRKDITDFGKTELVEELDQA